MSETRAEIETNRRLKNTAQVSSSNFKGGNNCIYVLQYSRLLKLLLVISSLFVYQVFVRVLVIKVKSTDFRVEQCAKRRIAFTCNTSLQYIYKS